MHPRSTSPGSSINFNSAPCALVTLSLDDVIIDANNTFYDWTSYLPENISGKNRFKDLLAKGSAIFYETFFSNIIRLGGIAEELNFELRAARGRLMQIILNAKLVEPHAGNEKVIILAFQKFSERKKLESQLIEARRLAEQQTYDKAEFIAHLSHEIRNPLQIISGIAALLEDQSSNPSYGDYVKILQNTTADLLQIANGVLDLSKVEGVLSDRSESDIDLKALSEKLVTRFKIAAAEKNLLVTLEIDSGIDFLVVGDAIGLTQVLSNLLGNAIKFTTSGSIHLKVELVDHSADRANIRFSVADTGIGIPPEQLQSIFTKYKQTAPNDSSRGFGFGLAISQQIVSKFDSKINVTSDSHGTTFSFTLNFRKTTKEPLPQSATPSLSGIRILVADDNETSAFIFQRMLTKHGCKVDVCNSGADALNAIIKNPYDLMLTDLNMPDLSGIELTEKIRHHNDLRVAKTRVILCSADQQFILSNNAVALGFDDFVLKPILEKDLVRVISKHVEKESLEPNAKKSLFTLSEITAIAGNDDAILKELIQKSIVNLKSAKHDWNEALKNGNIPRLKQIIHKTSTLLGYLKADEVLNNFQSVLAAFEGREEFTFASERNEALLLKIDQIVNDLESLTSNDLKQMVQQEV